LLYLVWWALECSAIAPRHGRPMRTHGYHHAVENTPDVRVNITIAVQRLMPIHENNGSSNSEPGFNSNALHGDTYSRPCHTNNSYSFHNATVRNASTTAVTTSSGSSNTTRLPRPQIFVFPRKHCLRRSRMVLWLRVHVLYLYLCYQLYFVLSCRFCRFRKRNNK
jgi:hypothetical protein